MQHATIAVDLAKSVFEIAVSRHQGKVAEGHRLSRERFLSFLAEHLPATVLMEACGSAHHGARQLEAHRNELIRPGHGPSLHVAVMWLHGAMNPAALRAITSRLDRPRHGRGPRAFCSRRSRAPRG